MHLPGGDVGQTSFLGPRKTQCAMQFLGECNWQTFVLGDLLTGDCPMHRQRPVQEHSPPHGQEVHRHYRGFGLESWDCCEELRLGELEMWLGELGLGFQVMILTDSSDRCATQLEPSLVYLRYGRHTNDVGTEVIRRGGRQVSQNNFSDFLPTRGLKVHPALLDKVNFGEMWRTCIYCWATVIMWHKAAIYGHSDCSISIYTALPSNALCGNQFIQHHWAMHSAENKFIQHHPAMHSGEINLYSITQQCIMHKSIYTASPSNALCENLFIQHHSAMHSSKINLYSCPQQCILQKSFYTALSSNKLCGNQFIHHHPAMHSAKINFYSITQQCTLQKSIYTASPSNAFCRNQFIQHCQAMHSAEIYLYSITQRWILQKSIYPASLSNAFWRNQFIQNFPAMHSAEIYLYSITQRWILQKSTYTASLSNRFCINQFIQHHPAMHSAEFNLYSITQQCILRK